MAKKTVLEYVQGALNIMDSDQVDSIADTEESMQVANLLRDVYDELMTRQEKGWSFLNRTIQLEASVDTSQPTRLVLPERTRHLKKLWYNVSDEAGKVKNREIKYVCPEDFICRFGTPGDTRQLVTTPEGISFYVFNDRMPSFYTSFDDRVLYLDSFDSSVETTLTSSRAVAFANVLPELIVEDEHVPDLPLDMVPLLTSTLNAAASLTFRQMASAPDETRARRQIAQLRRTESKLTRERYYHNAFGRR